MPAPADSLRDELRAPPPLPETAALFLDLDGTLADLALRPDRVTVAEELPQRLIALRQQLAGACAVLSGRTLAEVDRLLFPAVLPGAGVHGAELRFADAQEVRALHPADAAATLVVALRERFGADGRVVVEDKGAAVALHYRQAPELAVDCDVTLRALVPPGGPFEVIHGSMVVEARPVGASKGAALRALMREPPFAGRVPVCVGDDITDEDGFAAAQALGGFGVKVRPGRTCARYRLAWVEDVHDWLGLTAPA